MCVTGSACLCPSLATGLWTPEASERLMQMSGNSRSCAGSWGGRRDSRSEVVKLMNNDASALFLSSLYLYLCSSKTTCVSVQGMEGATQLDSLFLQGVTLFRSVLQLCATVCNRVNYTAVICRIIITQNLFK